MIRITLPLLLLFSATVLRAAEPPQCSLEERTDYVFGNYAGEFPSPPHADANPRRAIIIRWKQRPETFVFWHEASYCPFFELPDGSAACFQFWEGNDGWAELFNDYGRRESNSSVEIREQRADRIWIRWTYFGVNMTAGERAYRATEDFYAYSNGLVLRRQTYETLKPGDPHGYAREPIELIAMCPRGKLWKDILRDGERPNERHALAVLDLTSDARYDVFWTPKPGTLLDCTTRRTGAPWKQLDDARAVAMILPLKGGLPFCILADIGGYDPRTTRLKEHTFPDTGGQGWSGSSWDHWPIGWLNSQAHPVDAASLAHYPNHFSPMGMDLFAVPNEQVEKKDFWSLYGVARDVDSIRNLARAWIEKGPQALQDIAALPGP